MEPVGFYTLIAAFQRLCAIAAIRALEVVTIHLMPETGYSLFR
jgi:hypothetical protein